MATPLTTAAPKDRAEERLWETTLASQTIYQGRLLKVYVDQVRLADGSEHTREYICHPGAVAMIAVKTDGRLLFERQFRYPMQRVMLEIPAGKIETNEAPLATAQRELAEETGYVSDHWHYLGTIHNCIAYSDERILIYLADNCRQSTVQTCDHGEVIDVVDLSPDEALAAVHSGEITDAKTISALFFWLANARSKTL